MGCIGRHCVPVYTRVRSCCEATKAKSWRVPDSNLWLMISLHDSTIHIFPSCANAAKVWMGGWPHNHCSCSSIAGIWRTKSCSSSPSEHGIPIPSKHTKDLIGSSRFVPTPTQACYNLEAVCASRIQSLRFL